MSAFFDVLIQGSLLGAMYALFAIGLSLVFGIMRIINVAHGDFIVLAAYLALTVVSLTGLHPLATLLFVVPLMAGLGYGLQRGILNRTLGEDILPPLLVTFGLSIILQNLLLEGFSADSRKLQAGTLETASLSLGQEIAVGVFPLLILGVAVGITAGLQILFYRTELGRVFRATSDDKVTVRLMGVKNTHVYGLAMGLAFGVVAIAGVLLSIRSNFDPSMGPPRLLYAFEAVIIGGLGSLWGTLAGGILLGIAQSIGAKIDPGLQILAGHVAFLLVLILRPQGLFPKSQG